MSSTRLSPSKLAIVLVDVRSAHNVGAIWRSADACAVNEVILVGITPHPKTPNDSRPGHVIARHEREIAKSALGAELTVPFTYFSNFSDVLPYLNTQRYQCFALECNRQGATNLYDWLAPVSSALFVGSETTGLSQTDCNQLESVLEIPMYGQKSSLNVAVAAGIGLYEARRQTSASLTAA